MSSDPRDIPEYGMAIQRRTLCKVGGHVWTWASSGTGDTDGPHPSLRCECGLLSYGQLKEDTAMQGSEERSS
jgi:hypothetical protein